jgi:hypothetical protein
MSDAAEAGTGVGAGEDERGRSEAGGVGETPAVDVEHRRQREHHVAAPDRMTVDHQLTHGVEHDRPMRVDDSLRSPGGAAGVTDRGGVVLVHLCRFRRVVSGDQVLVVGIVCEDRVDVSAIFHHDELLDG